MMLKIPCPPGAGGGGRVRRQVDISGLRGPFTKTVGFIFFHVHYLSYLIPFRYGDLWIPISNRLRIIFVISALPKMRKLNPWWQDSTSASHVTTPSYRSSSKQHIHILTQLFMVFDCLRFRIQVNNLPFRFLSNFDAHLLSIAGTEWVFDLITNLS